MQSSYFNLLSSNKKAVSFFDTDGENLYFMVIVTFNHLVNAIQQKEQEGITVQLWTR